MQIISFIYDNDYCCGNDKPIDNDDDNSNNILIQFNDLFTYILTQ
jgi:hypothetical protein